MNVTINMAHREQTQYLPNGGKKQTLTLENGRQIILYEPAQDKKNGTCTIVQNEHEVWETWKDIPDELAATLIYSRRLCPSCWCDEVRSPLTLVKYGNEPTLVCIFCDWTDMEIEDAESEALQGV